MLFIGEQRCGDVEFIGSLMTQATALEERSRNFSSIITGLCIKTNCSLSSYDQRLHVLTVELVSNLSR
ncbi:CLUMA_CG017370, isoform A [Clunio marinus]|uniref:CLUMA_CG017370, isoform A n=1 Tax=Clunio marinus TaxID=568069 RepID=A0A1J1IVZ1_9DIPT|nr:CLUMA_CG017370, isoform A [Clunio marinus]